MKRLNLGFISGRRQELKLSMQEMACRLGFRNASTYSKYEKGEYAFKADHLPVLCEQLDCGLGELFVDCDLLKQKTSSREEELP